MEPIQFQSKYVEEQSVVLYQGKYGDGTTAILVQSLFGKPLCTATVSLAATGDKPAEGNVFIYGNYSQHEGVWEGLHKAGVVGDIVQRIPMGGYDAEAFECPLLRDDLRPM